MSIVVNEQTLYSIEGDKIQIRNFQVRLTNFFDVAIVIECVTLGHH